MVMSKLDFTSILCAFPPSGGCLTFMPVTSHLSLVSNGLVLNPINMDVGLLFLKCCQGAPIPHGWLTWIGRKIYIVQVTFCKRTLLKINVLHLHLIGACSAPHYNIYFANSGPEAQAGCLQLFWFIRSVSCENALSRTHTPTYGPSPTRIDTLAFPHPFPLMRTRKLKFLLKFVNLSLLKSLVYS